MVHFVGYPALAQVQEHTKPVMEIFNAQMMKYCYAPAILLMVSTTLLYWVSPPDFPKWAIITSIFLAAISVITTLFLIAPIHAALPVTGLAGSIKQQLLWISLNFQIMPAALQVVFALYLLNIYLKETKIFTRWLFILFFGLLYYSVGAGFVESFVNYPLWSFVGERDWLAFRLSGTAAGFFLTFLIPSILPMFLSILLFWWRPTGFSKSFLLVFLLTNIWTTIITAIYFVPKIQLPLDKVFSLVLINDLNANNFLYRGLILTIGEIAIACAFLKIVEFKKQHTASNNVAATSKKYQSM